jgi:hypothetical protein
MHTLRRRHPEAGALALALLGASHPATAQLAPDELTPPERLDRRADVDDPSSSDLWIAASGQARLGTDARAFGAGIVVGASLDAWAAPRVAAIPLDDAPTSAAGPPVRIDAALARGAVSAALARAHVADAADRLDGLASRSRSSATLPELRLRAMRVIDEDEALSPTEYDPSRVTLSGGSSTWLEARATWKLDRLVFAREEIAVERLRAGQARAARAVEHDVIEALSRWHRARWRSLDPEAPAEARIEADLEVAAVEATLDVWTDGWFSRELARRSR